MSFIKAEILKKTTYNDQIKYLHHVWIKWSGQFYRKEISLHKYIILIIYKSFSNIFKIYYISNSINVWSMILFTYFVSNQFFICTIQLGIKQFKWFSFKILKTRESDIDRINFSIFKDTENGIIYWNDRWIFSSFSEQYI